MLMRLHIQIMAPHIRDSHSSRVHYTGTIYGLDNRLAWAKKLVLFGCRLGFGLSRVKNSNHRIGSV